MHDEQLSIAVKDAGESFEPPWLDVRAVARRGRRRWWLTRAVATTTSLAVIAAGAAVVTRVDLARPETTAANEPAAPGLRQWERIPAAPMAGRGDAASAWTGDELIVFGGSAGGTRAFEDGASYDPATRAWTKLPAGPGAWPGHTAVWTGTELILWGGEFGDGSHKSPWDGAAYDPSTREWRDLPDAPFWSLAGHTAVWTGTEMLVWGGVTSGQSWAAAYDPVTNEWRSLPNGPLESRHGHEAVWTGDRMIVWGGLSQLGIPVEVQGAEYDPATGRWNEIPEAPVDLETAAVSFWTGKEMVVAGGLGETMASREGAAYDPARRTWREIEDVPVAIARGGAPTPLTDLHTTPVWTGSRALFVTADGVLAYEPDADRWLKPATPRDAWRLDATAAWTGEELLLWSGRTWDDQAYVGDGWSGSD
jgi:hypothetical protein